MRLFSSEKHEKEMPTVSIQGASIGDMVTSVLTLSPRGKVWFDTDALDFELLDDVIPQILKKLKRQKTDTVIRVILQKVTDYALDRITGRISGASKLCEFLGEINSDESKNALFTIVKASVRLSGFDFVKATAIRALASFNDETILPQLHDIYKENERWEIQEKAALQLYDYLIENGVEVKAKLTVILAKGIQIAEQQGREEAIDYYYEHLDQISHWTQADKSTYYYQMGFNVERLCGETAALPFYAASLRAACRDATSHHLNPSPDLVVWHKFQRRREFAALFALAPKDAALANTIFEKYSTLPKRDSLTPLPPQENERASSSCRCLVL